LTMRNMGAGRVSGGGPGRLFVTKLTWLVCGSIDPWGDFLGLLWR
jgi:hypothetical protein